MKKIIYLVCICLFCIASSAMATGKTYKLTSNSVTLTKVDTNAGDIIQIKLYNLTTSALTIKYTIANNTFAYCNWHYWFCDLNQCYTGKYSATNTNLVGPSDSSAFSIQVFSYSKTPANEIMQIALYDASNPAVVDTITFRINALRLGIPAVVIPSSAVSIFPNPASGFLNIKSEVTDFSPVKADIMNVEGKTISEIALTPGTGKISVADLPKGTYLIRLRDLAGRESTKNFIKE